MTDDDQFLTNPTSVPGQLELPGADGCAGNEALRAGYLCSCRKCRRTPDRFRAKAKDVVRQREQW